MKNYYTDIIILHTPTKLLSTPPNRPFPVIDNVIAYARSNNFIKNHDKHFIDDLFYKVFVKDYLKSLERIS